MCVIQLASMMSSQLSLREAGSFSDIIIIFPLITRPKTNVKGFWTVHGDLRTALIAAEELSSSSPPAASSSASFVSSSSANRLAERPFLDEPAEA